MKQKPPCIAGLHLTANAPLKNEQLHEIRDGIRDTLFRLQHQHKELTAKQLKEEYRNPEGDKVPLTIKELAEEFIQCEAKGKSPSTRKSYHTYFKRLVDFDESQVVQEMKVEWGEKYRQHLISKAYETNYIGRCLKFVKQVLRFGVKVGHIQYNPLSELTIPNKQKAIIFLTEPELRCIEARRFDVPRLEKVRHTFLFQCYTGLAYADLRKLSKEHLIRQDRELWIQIERKKVRGAIALIPVTPAAKKVLERYDYQIPVLSNQRYNAYLKEIADLCQIKKNLTTHVARRTCGMYLLNRGVKETPPSRPTPTRSPKAIYQTPKPKNQQPHAVGCVSTDDTNITNLPPLPPAPFRQATEILLRHLQGSPPPQQRTAAATLTDNATPVVCVPTDDTKHNTRCLCPHRRHKALLTTVQGKRKTPRLMASGFFKKNPYSPLFFLERG